MDEEKKFGYAILVDPEVLKQRVKEEKLEAIIERAKESTEIAIRTAIEGFPVKNENRTD